MYIVKKLFFLSLFIVFQSIAGMPQISFDKGFGFWPRNEIVTDEAYYVCRQLYDDYVQYGFVSDDYRIPKVIHLIWIGSPLPDRCIKLMESWKLNHPDWAITVWTDAEVDDFNMTNIKAFNEAINKGQKSDIWRYEILYRFGGLYIDTDFECLKSFDDLHKSCDFYAGCISSSYTAVLNGIIGSKMGHPILSACIERLRITQGDRNDFTKILKETGPDFFSNIIV